METSNKLVESSNSCVSILSENFKDLERIVTRRDSVIAAANDIQGATSSKAALAFQHAKSSDMPNVESGSEAEEIASPKAIRNYSHLLLTPVCEEILNTMEPISGSKQMWTSGEKNPNGPKYKSSRWKRKFWVWRP
ncbi:Uncharacterized protein Fot_09919 [Forsythia ovata]|uniref:Uncharacterized protein n=1 Tax=Forsythia ovata TaxID=205694 RepID=A0ABD1WFC2_9LAMI